MGSQHNPAIDSMALMFLCFGFAGVFWRWLNGPASVLDHFRDAGYGIYLVHYAFVVWLQ